MKNKKLLFALSFLILLALIFWTAGVSGVSGDRYLAPPVNEDVGAKSLSPDTPSRKGGAMYLSPGTPQHQQANEELIQTISHTPKLATTEYHLHKLITHDDAWRLKGRLLNRSFNVQVPLGDRKIAIPMDAKVKAYIDFSTFSERNIERSGDHLTIILPDPELVLTSTRIDQQSVKQYVGLTRAHFSDAELANYQQQGREAILQSLPGLGIEETARANAAKVLVPLLVQMGYHEQQVTIMFRKDLDFKHRFKELIRYED